MTSNELALRATKAVRDNELLQQESFGTPATKEFQGQIINSLNGMVNDLQGNGGLGGIDSLFIENFKGVKESFTRYINNYEQFLPESVKRTLVETFCCQWYVEVL